MRKLVASIIALATFAMPLSAFAAIAFNASGIGGSGMTLTVGTLTNGIGIAFIHDGGNDAASCIPLWGGNAMTTIRTDAHWNAGAFSGAAYYILNPAAGSTAVTYSGCTAGSGVSAATYSGVSQTSPIDTSTTTSNTASPLTSAITTNVNNDWIVDGGSSITGVNCGNNTNFVKRSTDGDCIGDSNANVTPAGSFSQTVWSPGSGTSNFLIQVAIEPAAAPAPVSVLQIIGGTFKIIGGSLKINK